MIYKSTIVMTLALCNFFCTAQNVFNKRIYVGSGFLETTTTVKIIDDTIIFSNACSNYETGTKNLFLGKVNNIGELVDTSFLLSASTNLYSGAGNNALVKHNQSYFGFSGYTNSQSFASTLLIKLNGDLDTIWTKPFNQDSLFFEMGTMGCIVDDSLVIFGQSNKLDSDGDFWIAKMDLLGNVGWTKYYGGLFEERQFSFIQTTDGGYLVCGLTKSNTLDGEYDGIAYKLDSMGNLEWTFQDKNIYPDNPLYFENSTDGGYIGVGFDADSAHDNGSGDYDYFGQPFSVKIDSNGDEVWRKHYTLPYGQGTISGVWQIRPTLDGNYVILGMHGRGMTDSEIPYKGRGFLMKITPDGDSLWYREYKKLLNENTYNYMRDVAVHPDGGYVMTGFLWAVGAPDTGYQDMWLVKTNCLGFDHEPEAAATWNADDNFKIILDNNSQYFGNCIINWGDGTSNYIYEGYDTLISHTYDDDFAYTVEVIAFACGSYDTTYVTVYPQVLSLDETESNQLIRLYPNPASEGFYISAQLAAEIERVLVYDLQGNLIMRYQIANENDVYYVETNSLSDGMYLIRVAFADGNTEVLKLNVIH